MKSLKATCIIRSGTAEDGYADIRDCTMWTKHPHLFPQRSGVVVYYGVCRIHLGVEIVDDRRIVVGRPLMWKRLDAIDMTDPIKAHLPIQRALIDMDSVEPIPLFSVDLPIYHARGKLSPLPRLSKEVLGCDLLCAMNGAIQNFEWSLPDKDREHRIREELPFLEFDHMDSVIGDDVIRLQRQLINTFSGECGDRVLTPMRWVDSVDEDDLIVARVDRPFDVMVGDVFNSRVHVGGMSVTLRNPVTREALDRKRRKRREQREQEQIETT